MKRIYYYLELENISPIHIGNGENTYTDLDVIKDENNQFYIPGTSLTGSIVHSLDKNDQELIQPQYQSQSKQSPIIINDARMINMKGTDTEVRNGISLDENKITNHTAKYDYEVIPSGQHFELCIEVIERGEISYDLLMNKIFSLIQNKDIKVGYKTTRGLGRLSIVKLGRKEFSKDNFKEYFSFNRYNYHLYDELKIEDIQSDRFITIEAYLHLKGGISIRTYNTSKGDADFEHITSQGQPIIPATSWNGLLRKTIKQYIHHLDLNLDIIDLFGSDPLDHNPENRKKSKVYIEESVIDADKDSSVINQRMILQSRTRIDPFYGGTVNGSLYQEKSYYHGDTKLTISLSKDIQNIELAIQLFILFFKELNDGFLALGGETSIGRGLFDVKKILVDNKEITYQDYMEEISC